MKYKTSLYDATKEGQYQVLLERCYQAEKILIHSVSHQLEYKHSESQLAAGDRHLECGEAVEPGGVHRFRGHVGDVCDELLQVATGLLQVGGVNDDLHQLQDSGGDTGDVRKLASTEAAVRRDAVPRPPQSALCGASWWGSEGSCSGFWSAEGWWISSTCRRSPSSLMNDQDEHVDIEVVAASRNVLPARPTSGGGTLRT